MIVILNRNYNFKLYKKLIQYTDLRKNQTHTKLLLQNPSKLRLPNFFYFESLLRLLYSLFLFRSICETIYNETCIGAQLENRLNRASKAAFDLEEKSAGRQVFAASKCPA